MFYLLAIIAFTASTTQASLPPSLSDEFIVYVNSSQNLWTAGRNFHQGRPLVYFKRLMGSLRDIGSLPQKRYKSRNGQLTKLPKNFDARERWHYCPTLRQVRDQGSCGSCWAVSSASAMTDRVCINSTGWNNFYFSEDDLLTCCNNCGAGCDGGILSKAWLYSQTEGTVSGGTYNSHHGCKPYEIAPCEHGVPGYRPECGYVTQPKCRQVCQRSYMKKYTDDKKKIGQVYALKNRKAIKMDIFKYGPVTTSFKVYADFLHYKSGIYKHVSGEYLGDHAIKLLGWGVENNVKYWLAANSWNTDWGENGFFKIVRGKNHCEVEDHVVAGHVLP